MLITADDYYPIAQRFEGEIPWLYLDTAGLVTVGIGRMIPDPDAMAAVDMVDGAGAPAGDAAKRAAYAAVHAAQDRKGQVAGAFKDLTPLRLTQAGSRALFDASFATLFGEAKTIFKDVAGGFGAWPQDVQLATFDMAYNLGPQRLYDLFPTFREQGLAKRDYKTCADECERGGIGQARNDWTRAEFLKAAG